MADGWSHAHGKTGSEVVPSTWQPTRCHVSVRSLQQGFRRYMGASPMAYLREVRLRRAHQSLLDSDPSIASVASVAYNWGFTNLGRFAAAHTARYDEPPAATLRRRTFRRSQVNLRCTE